MTLFKLPEVASVYGALATTAFTDGSPATAHKLREVVRNGNLEKGRGGLMARWVADPRTSGERPGAGLAYAPPYWQHAVQALVVPVAKKHDLVMARVRIRAVVTLDARVGWFVGFTPRPTPRTARASLGEVGVMTGTGSAQVLELEVPMRAAPGETLSIYLRHMVDPTKDALLDTGTYGSPNTGSVSTVPTPYSFGASGASWSGVHTGGHYVLFTSTGGGVRHVPARIVDTLSTTEWRSSLTSGPTPSASRCAGRPSRSARAPPCSCCRWRSTRKTGAPDGPAGVRPRLR